MWFRLALVVIAIVIGALGILREWTILPWTSPARVAQPTRARAEIGIEGMDCLMCAAGLQNKLRALPGVSKAEVIYQDRRASVEFDPAVINRARLVVAITSDGFKVESLSPAPRPTSDPSPARSR